MSLLEKLRKPAAARAPSQMSVADWCKTPSIASSDPRIRMTRGTPVEMSTDLARVLALPRRAQVELGHDDILADGTRVRIPPDATALALVDIMNERLRRPERACVCRARYQRECIKSLLPAQAWALYEAPLADGILGAIGVGHGKTGLDILLPMVMRDCKQAVLLIPPGLVAQFIEAYCLWREHWNVPSLVMSGGEHVPGGGIITGRPVLTVVPYSRLSRQEATALLKTIDPDLVIADEGHRLRHPNTATTGRVMRAFDEKPTTRLACYSGTIISDSIKNAAHLSAMALGEGSPFPLEPNIVEEWASAIDPSDLRAPAGELRRFCKPEETLYQGYHRRLVETRGFIATRAGAIDAEINITERKPPPLPRELQTMLDTLRAAWVRPDGEELVEALDVARCARQLAQGFYYRWKFPRGEPRELIDEWFRVRKLYRKELREVLKDRREHMDSELLCAKAAQRALDHYHGPLPTWDAQFYAEWIAIKDQVYHETEAVRVNDYLVRDACAWGVKHKGVIWYREVAFGEWCAELSGLPLYGGGDDAAKAIVAESGRRSIIASIKAHGTGRDGLQHKFREQLVASPPSRADDWEQLLGRLHRIGQRADEVDTEVYRHTPEMEDAIDRALVQAKFIQGTMGTLQKLLIANVDFKL